MIFQFNVTSSILLIGAAVVAISSTLSIHSTLFCAYYPESSVKPGRLKRTEHFDGAVQLAHDFIEAQLPNRKHKPFVLSRWEQKTDGGLQEKDRIYIGKLYGASESVFEYGLGESTYIANEVGVRRYAGIDSDAAWITQTRAQVSDHFRFYFADIGPTIHWGHPFDPDLAKNILNYQLMPLIVEPQPFDVYMVDGRWRLPCMIISFLHASARGADRSKTIVIVHDCLIPEIWGGGQGSITKPRAAYHLADDLIERVDHSGNLVCMFKRKAQTTDEQLLQFWEENYSLID